MAQERVVEENRSQKPASAQVEAFLSVVVYTGSAWTRLAVLLVLVRACQSHDIHISKPILRASQNFEMRYLPNAKSYARITECVGKPLKIREFRVWGLWE